MIRKYRLLITDPVATAPCTDCVQVRFLLLRQSPVNRFLYELTFEANRK